MSKIPMYQYKPEELAGLTVGRELQFIRKLRKLSVEALAEKSGLAVETIKAAEKDSFTLSIEQIERLALAADCHPSSIAFPLWSSIAYAPEQVTVKGELRVNSSVNSTELKLFLSKGYGLSISGGNRKSVRIYVFNTAMTSGLGYAPERKTEIHYEISGDALGSLNDVYQSGPDFDGDHRIIKNLELNISHFRNAVSYQIRGFAADEGGVSAGRPPDSPPGNWRFVILFSVPVEELRKFYGLYPSAEVHFIQRLSTLGDAPTDT